MKFLSKYPVRFLRAHHLGVGLAAGGVAGAAGILNSLSSMGTFASILVTVIFPRRSGLFLGPLSIKNGYITPFTGLYDPSIVMLSRTEPRMNCCFSTRISMYVSGSR